MTDYHLPAVRANIHVSTLSGPHWTQGDLFKGLTVVLIDKGNIAAAQVEIDDEKLIVRKGDTVVLKLPLDFLADDRSADKR